MMIRSLSMNATFMRLLMVLAPMTARLSSHSRATFSAGVDAVLWLKLKTPFKSNYQIHTVISCSAFCNSIPNLALNNNPPPLFLVMGVSAFNTTQAAKFLGQRSEKSFEKLPKDLLSQPVILVSFGSSSWVLSVLLERWLSFD